MTPLTPSDFPTFFSALWGYSPFDWQTRLLTAIYSEGWPETLDLPTGSGKTATLDIALFALALDAFVPPAERKQPRRIVLVVDRRVVVDQAHLRAVHIARELAKPKDGVLAEVAAALRRLQGEADSNADTDAPPVQAAIMRGGMPQETTWTRSPHQPVLLVSTVDQVGSRLLFRGYGVSDSMKPVHAGLLGFDTLVLLDEVHLSRPFEETLSEVSRLAARDGAGAALPHRPLAFVRMSATPAGHDCEARRPPFTLSDADRTHPVLAQRLRASKRARLREIATPKDPERARAALAKTCVEEAKRLVAGGARDVAVIVNRVDTARRAADLAESGRSSAGWDVELMTGRMRPLDRNELQRKLLERVRAGHERKEDRSPLLVVATQSIEAGADLDFDALVTECASLDALRQRFGRLDRLGDLGITEAVVVTASKDLDEKAEPDPIYGTALRETWLWLQERAKEAGDGDRAPHVDFGIEALGAILARAPAAELAPLLPPRRVAPVLLESHLDRWVQTSPAPSADPDVSVFLHGQEAGSPEVLVVWRADLSPELLARATRPQDGERSEEPAAARQQLSFVREILRTVPPSTLEALPVPIWAASSWLAAVEERARGGSVEVPAISDVEVEARPEAEPAKSGTTLALAVAWRGEKSAVVSTAREIDPGATLVVPATYGGLSRQFRCWDPTSMDPVDDRGDEANLLQRGRVVVRWQAGSLRGWSLEGRVAQGPLGDAKDFLEDFLERGEDAERERFTTWRNEVLAGDARPWARLALEAIDPTARRKSPVVRLGDDTPEVPAWRATVGVQRIPPGRLLELAQGFGELLAAESLADASTEGDGGSFSGERVSLARHQEGVEELVRRFGEALGVPAPILENLALAARLHDLGKADRRFQILLFGGDEIAAERALAEGEPLAKSGLPRGDIASRRRARERSGYPKDARHELTSLALVERSESVRELADGSSLDWDLLLHLIGSHHGCCRPFAPPVLDSSPVRVTAQSNGYSFEGTSDHRLARFDSGVADRFWLLVRRYGWWGLAWLEATLRLADHRTSEIESTKGSSHA